MIWTREKIDNYIQTMLKPWLDDGSYHITTACMNGTQGEKFKLDITDGKSIYRFWLMEGHMRVENKALRYSDYVDYIEFAIYKYSLTEDEWKYVYDGHYTLWFDENKADVLYSQKFYVVNRYQYHENKVYTDSLDDIINIMIKRDNKKMPYKDEYRHDNITLSNTNKKVIRDMIKSEYRGFSTLKVSDIDHMVRRQNRYDAVFTDEYKNSSKNRNIHYYGYIRIKSF